jgi:dipeptidyl aminopeptidase/acylaminoacyl peptidase
LEDSFVITTTLADAFTGAGSDNSAGTPLSPEEIVDRVVPRDPQVSPDGPRVVFVAAPLGRKDEKPTQALWLAEAGRPARKLTPGTSNDSSPRWSPDGTRILFRSDRQKSEDGECQLYLLPVAGGESLTLGDLKGELSQASWSPDGRHVAVLRQDPEPELVKKRKKERDDAVVVEEDPRLTRLWVIDVESGRARCLTTGDREVRGYTWTPDSESLVAVTTDAAEYDAVFGPSDLWQLPLAGGLPRRIARFRTMGSSPLVVDTSDGPLVVVKSDGHRAEPADSVWTVPLSGGEPQNRLPGLQGIVEEIVALPGHPDKIAARIVERTHGRLYAVDIVSGELTPISPPDPATEGSIIAGVSFSADGKQFAGIWSDSVTPEQVFLADPGGRAHPVTTFGDSFSGRLQPAEHVTWTSDDGVEIEGLLIHPAGHQPGKRYPLVVQIHGGPSWQWEDRVMLDWHDWAQFLASHGYAVLLPNPRGSTGYGNDFQKLLQDDVGGGESRDLIAGALAMVERGIADPDRLGIGGWSWGGYLTAWTISQTDIFRAAVMGAGLSNMISDHGQGDIPSANLLYYPGHPYHHMEHYWKSSPIRYVSAVRTPTLILHGDEDARVHPAQGMEYFRALKVLGVPVRLVRYPREKHGFEERLHQIDLMNRIVDWFDRYLKRAPAPNLNGARDE